MKREWREGGSVPSRSLLREAIGQGLSCGGLSFSIFPDWPFGSNFLGGFGLGRAARRYQTLLLLVFGLGAVLAQLDRQSIAILKTELMLDLGWSDEDYASVVTMSQVVSASSLLFVGILAPLALPLAALF